jgi:hypothetical protein
MFPITHRARQRATTLLVLAGLSIPALPHDVQAQATASSGDSTGRRRIQPLPALGSSPESGLQLGASVLAVWTPPARVASRPAWVQGSVLRSVKAQTRVVLEGERWSAGNARRLAGSVAWQRFPLPYFGVGDTATAAAEEIFTPTGFDASFTLQQRARGAWYVLGTVRHLDQRIVTDTVGALRSGLITGSLGGRISEFTVGLTADTRDHLFMPTRGHWMTLTYGRSLSGVLSDFSYSRLRVDARAYRAVATGHVFATQLLLTGVPGAPPFDQLALVGGGDILRGYTRGRYRDRWLAAGQLEYRTPVVRRIGGVAFAGAGVASPSVGALFTDRVLLPTYGVGARVLLDQQQGTSVRVDYGRGRDAASGLYIGFNQAF